MTTVKLSKELADILQEASKEVDGWQSWQRSLDPQGSLSESAKTSDSNDEGPGAPNRKAPAA